jgi:hypothetical protein
MKLHMPAVKKNLAGNGLICFTFAALTAACIYIMVIFPQVD